ncbi:catalase-like [Photinus pyralis]|uniref:catalase-like n=1 Tax=Photinus pyralis TaxID=7054 RepID=UPI001266FE52|nr:catalase-like [Photinus pyralis]
MSRLPSARQLQNYFKENGEEKSPATNNAGIPLAYKDASLTVGPKGSILLQDTDYIDEIAHFDRERIPERVVHAKGAGARGFFEVTHDITKYTSACVFSAIGQKTPVAVRFSSVIGESGSADTVRDPRGFAIKFNTTDGIWDLVGNNTPIFFVRDPILFPNFIHSFKRNPVTHLTDYDSFWDFLSLRPETLHQVLILFSDRGLPDGHTHMHGYGSHTFSFINSKREVFFCKFHFKTKQGIKNIDPDTAARLAGTDPDYSIRDLYNRIANKNYPEWTLYVQIMPAAEARTCPYDPFDVTKVWFQEDYPLQQVGRLVLDKNPDNYFAEIEQIGFSPSHIIPGIGISPDRMLQGRLFSYSDTQRYRLGTNHLQLPINSSFKVQNFSRDGPQTINNQGGAPNYHPNSFGGPNSSKRAKDLLIHFEENGITDRYDARDNDNYSQPRIFYQRVLSADERSRLIQNIVDHLSNANPTIRERAVKQFALVDADFGNKIKSGLPV